ncbi:IucA/IucC family protein [Vreelandella alkaliphila]|uniref:IucA/IucC family protein n=1 Tax=Vreelandella alkaliphila TaxID=272774 RepID=UPI003FD8AD9C
MGPSPRAIAEHASFQAFLHCYLREVDGGCWADNIDRVPSGGEDELRLETREASLAIEVRYRSLAGRHCVGRIWSWSSIHRHWQRLEPFRAIDLLVHELYARAVAMMPELRKSRELELRYRIIDSHRVMARYVETRRHDPRLMSDRFIDSEQSLLFGHVAHPTPKSRQGLADWQHPRYAPELAGGFPLHLFSVHQELVEQDSVAQGEATALEEALLKGALPELPAGHLPVPAHPLQAQWLLAQPAVNDAISRGEIRSLGELGPRFTATSSVRTLYNEDAAWMLKFSIPIRVTNSLRVNKAHELRAGLAMARLIERTGFTRTEPHFRFIQDPAYLTVRLPGLRESGFEAILRENPFPRGRDAGVISLAALTQEPLDGRSSRLQILIEGLAINEGRSLAAVSRDWFRHYLNCAIAPALRLYDTHGIALEAHQQNGLLDVAAGYPACFYYRDNQGYYLSQERRNALETLCPELTSSPELFYRDAMIRERFCYYLVINQLFSVIARFGQDGLLAESELLGMLRESLVRWQQHLRGLARPLLSQLLHDDCLPYKGNLLTRVHDVDELEAELEMAVYTFIANPIKVRQDVAIPESRHALA